MSDLISRQAVLKICRRYWHPTFNPIMEEVEKLPSAQPERETDNSCDGCAFIGCYETDYPCATCARRNKDYFTPTPKMEVEHE